MHHLLLAHGLAMPVIRANVPDAEAGICLNPTTFYPYGDSQADLDAAHREDGLRNRVWFDPLAGRGYPDDMVDLFRSIWPEIGQDDMEIIAAPTDFMGVNFYNPDYVEAGPEPPLYSRGVKPPNLPRTAMDWIIEPSRSDRYGHADPDRLRRCLEDAVRFRERRGVRRPPAPWRSRRPQAGAVYPRSSGGVAQGDRQRRAGEGAISSGRCWTTSNGPRAIVAGSALFMSTTRRRSGRSSALAGGMPRWFRGMNWLRRTEAGCVARPGLKPQGYGSEVPLGLRAVGGVGFGRTWFGGTRGPSLRSG